MNAPSEILAPILQFLGGLATPKVWIERALQEQETLLLDHRVLEYKAAQSALSLLGRHINRPELTAKMSRLVREELVHFEQVTRLIKKRGIALKGLSASRYAAGLRQLVRAQEPHKLIDTLIAGAFIEARSCERFAALVPYLDADLAKFYAGLLESEGRHFLGYIELARLYGGEDDVEARIELFRAEENRLIASPDEQFRFHSGVPVTL
ncbi:tRNA-(ms[2]io[6]A)-hydroxylase [Atopomonas sediminilitoris]|uniref:tRNA-(ms[2]io[6]A)-hydroxylase n=1 Tax=Atopomonas sediminilitoris TaxID=2919919 RepID=UPI001F4DAFC8|nr:tRNA isopentenyl-2-thiomethyl-A-37 hydroxylase MiaE [Atopomonas sediminilitoris]MCJ8168045.1 tRNA-(ms[2]io[6]A)-hydroxylase [Atopomonas sediminilitoris]